jgi:perosamine synthetase
MKRFGVAHFVGEPAASPDFLSEAKGGTPCRALRTKQPILRCGRLTSIKWCRPQINAEDRKAVDEILKTRFLANGGKVIEFQERFEEYIGGGRAIATSSCMAALHMAAILLDLKPGDEVLVPALTHVATAHAIELVGATPVFVDAHPESGNMDNQKIQEKVSKRTKAIFIVHYIGIPGYMRSTMDIARRHNLRVVEDCATALGTAVPTGSHVGLIGDIGCFSFHVKKHITTGGEGGMLVTKHPHVAERAFALRSFGYGADAYGDVFSPGLNYRMTEMQAALGTAQLARMPDLMAARIANLKELAKHLKGLPCLGSSYGMSVILPEGTDRDRIKKRLQDHDIETAVHYPKPIPDLACYRHKYGEQEFPVARLISSRSITLPVSPHLWPEQMAMMATKLHEAIDEDRTLRGRRLHRTSPGAEAEGGGPRAHRAGLPVRQPSRAVA